MNCILCNKEVERLDLKYPPSERPEQDCWRDGDVNRFFCGYGSNHDGNTYLISICDECITETHSKGIITLVDTLF